MDLFYCSLEAKKDKLGLSSDECAILGDDLLNKVIHKVDQPMYRLGNIIGSVTTLLLPIELRHGEYFILYDLDGMYIRGNIIEIDYIEEAFPEFYTTLNRDNTIDGIINEVGI